MRRTKRQRSSEPAVNVNNFIELDIEQHMCGNMNQTCKYCGAIFWINELNSSKKLSLSSYRNVE